MSRQIVLDTETTGLEISQGDRVIEIGCVELRGRRVTGNNFHQYLNPDREIGAGALRVHGITNEFLAQRPRFREVARALLDYLGDAELIIHNAAFDIGFLNRELELAGYPERLGAHGRVLDTWALARKLYPNQRVSLDALCKRHQIDNSRRAVHGALLDAQLTCEVYLAMTGGQAALGFEALEAAEARPGAGVAAALALAGAAGALSVVRASALEWQAHIDRLAAIESKSKGHALWRSDLPEPPPAQGLVASAVTTSK